MNSTIFKRFFCLSMLLSIVFVFVHPDLAYADSNPVLIKDDAKILDHSKVEMAVVNLKALRATSYSVVIYTFKMSFSGDKNADSSNFERQCETIATQTAIVLCIVPGDGTHYTYYSGGVEAANALTPSQSDASKKAFSGVLDKKDNDYTQATIAWLQVVAGALKANPQSVSRVYNSAENTTEQNLPKILAVIVLIFCVLVAAIMFVKGRRQGQDARDDEYEEDRRVVVSEEPPQRQPRLPEPGSNRSRKQDSSSRRGDEPQYLPSPRYSTGPSQQQRNGSRSGRLEGPSSEPGLRSGEGKRLPMLKDARVGDVVRVIRDGYVFVTAIVVRRYRNENNRLSVDLIVTHEDRKVMIPHWRTLNGDTYTFDFAPKGVYYWVKEYVRESEDGWDVMCDLEEIGLSYVVND